MAEVIVCCIAGAGLLALLVIVICRNAVGTYDDRAFWDEVFDAHKRAFHARDYIYRTPIGPVASDSDAVKRYPPPEAPKVDALKMHAMYRPFF